MPPRPSSTASRSGHTSTSQRAVSFGPQDSRVLKADGNARGGGQTFQELGRTGLRHWGGFLFEEWLRELTPGRRAAEAFREMGDSDPVTGGILYAIDILCRRAAFHIQPGGTSRADDEAKEFLEQCLFEDMSHTWEETLSEILSFVQYGWAYCEIVYKGRSGDSRDPTRNSKFDDGRIGIRKLEPRSQDSLWKWDFDDDGGVQAMVQQPPPTYELLTVPIQKALLFRTRSFKANPEGRSVLRSAFKAYFFKRNIENLQGIGIERDLAGLPVLSPPDDVDIWNANDPQMVAIRAQAEKLVRSIRRDEQEGVLKPGGWTLELLSTGGRRQFDIPAVLDYYDKRIASSILADVILLGQQQVGSYALADSKEGIFFSSLDTYLDQVCTVVNKHLVPRLFRLNSFAGITDYPKLQHGPVARLDLKTLSEFLKGLTDSGAEVWPNQELLEQVFSTAGLPVPEPDDGLPAFGAEPAPDDVGARPADAGEALPPLAADGATVA